MTSTTTSICCLIPLYAHVRTFPRKFPFIQYFNKRISILLFLTYLLTSCNTMENQKYAWIASPSAPEEYPMEIYKGALISEDYAYTFDPIWGVFNPGWGEAAGTMCSANYPAKLPNSLEMTWYSVVEDKYYTGKWKLDPIYIDSILNKFRIGGDMNLSFVIGLGPGGFVNVWLEDQSVIRIATLRATETKLTKENTNDSFEHHFRTDYRKVAYNLEEKLGAEKYGLLKKQGWPTSEYYDSLNKSYKWDLNIEGLDKSKIIRSYLITVSGEKIYTPGFKLNDVAPFKAIPSMLYINWKENNDVIWTARARFDYRTILSVFKEMGTEIPYTLTYSIDQQNHKLKVYLISSVKKVELETLEAVVQIK